MKKRFNYKGVCIPEKHYMVDISNKTAQIFKMVELGKEYKDMTVGEGLITALEQAIDYEKGKNVKGVKSRKISIAPYPIINLKK